MEFNEDKMQEAISRLINIETKINTILEMEKNYIDSSHADQFFGGRTYAQHGDDLIALCIFYEMGIKHPSYIDIGAHHPYNISNTALLYKMGCRGINVEPNPNLFKEFLRYRKEDININVGVSDKKSKLDFYMIDDFSGRNSFDRETVENFCKDNPEFKITRTMEIDVLTVNEIIDEYSGGKFPQFLTIDVEGFDLRILKSLDFSKSSPRLICIEFNSIKNRSTEENITEEMERRGFKKIFKAVSNLFFAK